MFKKIIFSIFLFSLFLIPGYIFAQENKNIVNVYFFWGNGCPHCANEKPFLDKIEKENEYVHINRYEVWENKENLDLLINIGKELGVNVSGVPLTLVGDESFVGYAEGYTSKQIEDRIAYCSTNKCKDSVASLAGLETSNGDGEVLASFTKKEIPESINLPIVGNINIKNFSLPLLTVILGGLDGFNPCAMWTLLFLISLLLGMENKKRMWILGSAFIISSALVYFMFMVAWLNLLLFLGFIVWVRISVGSLALIGGGYNIREYFMSQTAGCKITGSEKRQAVFEKLKKITQENSFWLALVGIVILAFAVNLVELICSAGLPAVYAQVLALSELSSLQYYLYISLYIFVFMLDDLVVFFIAMYTLEMVGITTKYTKWSHLIGGLLMVIIGFLLILRPDLLMF
ncbi:MAG: hypothetical protein UT05_C0002G0035 [Parcubacteria group bacterium GW2011_GWF2_38_76]|nr:MAG: hypothetical protein UT05_C0002G0035 [Parcubacteria group bacterium GW2011_GWF2_38_76]HBM45807.1 hypothetical protein [Patescibacteria group bacterium]